MPRRDGTGPMGQGALTGRGLGYCSEVNAGGAYRAGMSRGFGLRIGRGFGAGRGLGLAYGRTKGFRRFL